MRSKDADLWMGWGKTEPERFWARVEVVAAAKFGYAARSGRDGWVRNRMGRAVV